MVKWVLKSPGLRFLSNILSKLKSLRHKIIEAAADFDDVVAEKFIHEQPISIEEIKRGLRKGVIERKLTLAFGGSAFKNKGVQLVLDGVIDYLPSPLDVPPIEGTDIKTGAGD